MNLTLVPQVDGLAVGGDVTLVSLFGISVHDRAAPRYLALRLCTHPLFEHKNPVNQFVVQLLLVIEVPFQFFYFHLLQVL